MFFLVKIYFASVADLSYLVGDVCSTISRAGRKVSK